MHQLYSERLLNYTLFIAIGMLLSGCHIIKDASITPKTYPLLPAPPQIGSTEWKNDLLIYRQTRRLQGTPRWQKAIRDAEESSDDLIHSYSTTVGFSIDTLHTPFLEKLLERIESDEKRRTHMEKDFWKRSRPFVEHEGPVCQDGPAVLFPTWSYPSGHTVRGYAIAFALMKLFPQHEESIMKRAHEFGESRIICGMHWASDVQAGKIFAQKLTDSEMNKKDIKTLFLHAKQEIYSFKPKELQ